MNLKRCFQPLTLPTAGSLALLLLRVILGSAFILYGMPKIQNPTGWLPDSSIPGFFLFLAALSEFAGGIALVLGLLTPLASFGIACTMIVATYFHAILFKDPFVNTTGGGSYATALVYLGVALIFMTLGPGKFSLDRFIFKQR